MAHLQQDQARQLMTHQVESSPADHTQATLECSEDRFQRFAGEGPTQNADRERYELSVRVRVAGGGSQRGAFEGWREARASCGTLDQDDAQAALKRALTLAEFGEPNPELVPMGGPTQVPESAPQRPTLDHTFREKGEAVALALEACQSEGLVASGLVQTTALSRTLVNSEGRAVHGARSRASFSVTASPGGAEGASGFAEAIHANVERIDPAQVVRRAVDKAVRGRSPRAIEPGEYTVVLEPAAVASLLLFAAYQGFGAREVEEKSSFLCGRVGERLFPGLLTIRDHAANEIYPGMLFDGEGSARRCVDLLQDGILRGPVTDQRWADRLGVENTGHAVQQPSPDGPTCQNLVLSAGDLSLEDLVAGVERGLLVSQFHYTNMIEPQELTLTGMTRNGLFAIQGGRVAEPVQNLRFTQTLVGALQNVTGVGNQLEVAGALFDGEVICPALRIDNFRFTSTADF